VKLIGALEGLELLTEMGLMVFRIEVLQALQAMYEFKMVGNADVAWLVPTLTRELSMQETAPAITNKR
jgi:branched-chain amino acid transport system substrate-binding protein